MPLIVTIFHLSPFICLQGSAGPPPMNGLPSPAILVRNMFDPATETEEGWADDIRVWVEVQALIQWCSWKYDLRATMSHEVMM